MLSRRNLSQSSTGSGVGTPMKIFTRAVRTQTWDSLGRWMTRRGTRRTRLVPTSGGGGGKENWMSNYYLVSTGMRCFPKAGKNYFPCIKIKCIRDKKGLSVTASQSRMNIKIKLYLETRERKATFVMWLWPVRMVSRWKPTRWSWLAPVQKQASTHIDLRWRISFPIKIFVLCQIYPITQNLVSRRVQNHFC